METNTNSEAERHRNAFYRQHKETGKRKGGKKEKNITWTGQKIYIKIKNVREEHGFAANWGKPYK